MHCGDIFKIRDDAQFARPTVFVGAPRLYNRIVEGVKAKFNEVTGLKKCIIDSGMNSKISSVKEGTYTSGFYDAVVFSKVKDILGGRVRVMVSGSAPINPEVAEFMEAIMCCPLFEGYGQTECTGPSFAQSIYDSSVGNVGGVAVTLP